MRDTREISENGMPVDRVSSYIDGATIYNAQTGEMLYQKTYSLVKQKQSRKHMLSGLFSM